MRNLHYRIRVCVFGTCKGCLALSIAALQPLDARSFNAGHPLEIQSKGILDILDPFITQWILDGVSSLNENTPIEEAIRFAAKVKIEVEKLTGEHYSIKKLFKQCREEMKNHGINVDKHYFDGVADMIRQAEKDLAKGKNSLMPKRKPPLDGDYLKLPVSQTIGCVEVFCGVLICTLGTVFPALWVPGGAIIGDGCNRILNSLLEEGKIK